MIFPDVIFLSCALFYAAFLATGYSAALATGGFKGAFSSRVS